MSMLKIIGFTSFDEGYPTTDLSDENMEIILPLLSEEIAENGYFFSGEAHQYSQTGMPVFSNGTAFRASMNCWATLMAEIYSEKHGTDYTADDFYAEVPGVEVLPPEASLTLAPTLEEEEDYSGCTVESDHDLLREALMNRMPFFTADKTLRALYDSILEENQ